MLYESYVLRSSPNEIQVDASHYDGIAYNSPARVASYAEQISAVKTASANTVLEIGSGNSFVTTELRRSGLQVETVDIDPKLSPTYLASVTDLPAFIQKADCILCCQVLEHLPFSLLPECLESLLGLTIKRLVISLPDCSRYIRVCLASEHRSFIRPRIMNLPRLTQRDVVWQEHCWEIGAHNITSRKIINMLTSLNSGKVKSYRLFNNPYHRFFVIEKKT